MQEYIAFDIETTGLHSSNDRIVEIGCVRFSETGEEISRFQSLINPQVIITDELIKIHGITNEMVADQPYFEEVIVDFFAYLDFGLDDINQSTPILLAHKALFDIDFINAGLKRHNIKTALHKVVDTLAFAKHKNKFLRSYSLPNLAKHYNFEEGEDHRSIADCLKVKRLWTHLDGNQYLNENRTKIYHLLGRNLYEPERIA